MKSKYNNGVRGVWWSVLAVLITLLAGGGNKAQAFQHPGIPLTLSDLSTVKSNLNNAPWSSGYAALVADGRSSTNYTMQGPFGYVNRNYYGNYDNENAWKSDMQAAYNLARMWYFTGDANFARKSHDILIAWANTMTNFGGIEASFDLGDYAYRYAGGADILRGTWPGWTPTDTATMSNFFANVYWPDLSIPGLVTQGSQGMEEINAAVAIAVFNDDTNKFNQVLTTFLTDADSGLRDTYANGEVGDTGRDQGHAGLYVIDMAWTAEVFWKQGVDVFSIFDNRIHACGEYYSRYNGVSLQANLPYIPIGAPFWGLFNNIGGTPGSAGLDALSPNILHAAYSVRKGISTPYVDLNGLRGGDEEGFVYYKVADTSTATPPAIPSLPATASLTTGLTRADLNGCTPTGSASYSGGTWTLSSGYNGGDPWNYNTANDTVQFVYQQLTGDFTFIARVDSVSTVSGHDKAGLMLRDSLGSANERMWVAITSNTNFERCVRGWSDLPYGANSASIGSPILRFPYWVRMERVGDIVQTFTSADGASWAPACVAGFNSLPSTVYVGLFGTSLTTGTLSTAQISNVRITGGDGGGPLLASPAPFAVYASPGAGQVPLHWNESFMATNYTVWRSLTSGGSYTQIASVTNTFYLDTNIVPSTTYYYVVTASDGAGTSDNSIQDSATTQPLPPVPTGLNALAGNAQATLLWIAASGATSYNVKRSTTSGSGYVTVANVAGASFVETGLANGTAYYYVVSSVNAAGESANSTEASVTPSASAAALIWSGAVNGTWDTATANWLNGGAAAVFADGNAAIFDDSASANTAISLPANRSPGSVIFNNSSKNYTISGSAIAGSGQLIKQGGGSLTLNGANSYTGGTVNNGGTVTIGNAGAFGAGLVTLNGGTLNNSANTSVANNLLVSSNGGAIQLGSANNFTLTGALTGAGNLTLGGAGPLDSLYLGFSANTLSNGVITIPNSTGNNQTVVRFSAPTAGSASAAWFIGGAQDRGTTFDFGAGTISFGSLSGSGLLQGNSSGIHTMSVGALNTDSTFSGIIEDTSGTVAFIKTGAGTLWLTGANTYTGGTAVNAGSLVISTVSAANGTYTVANGATLAVTNISSGSAAATGLTLAAGSTLEFQNVASTTTPLIAAGSVIASGSCTVNITGTNGLAIGNTYPLTSYSGTLSGFANLQVQMPYGWRGTLVNSGNQIVLADVAVVAASSPQISVTPGSQQLQVTWPADHTGWRLEAQTNSLNSGLGTNWFTVSDSAATNQIILPVITTNGGVFYRLVYP
jgi:autotransporter-associated beta strand protein